MQCGGMLLPTWPAAEAGGCLSGLAAMRQCQSLVRVAPRSRAPIALVGDARVIVKYCNACGKFSTYKS